MPWQALGFAALTANLLVFQACFFLPLASKTGTDISFCRLLTNETQFYRETISQVCQESIDLGQLIRGLLSIGGEIYKFRGRENVVKKQIFGTMAAA
jgi:hypothetical protein